MKIVSVIGARPQFVKSATLSRELRKVASEVLVHTGQHYDSRMSDVFFRELGLPDPDYSLGVGSGSHGEQTGEMLKKIERVLEKEQPDGVLVYGDTNSTLSGALAAAKLRIPLIHLEAGLRSFNRSMPEEVNRIVTDHVSDLLLCPTETAVANLGREGIAKGVHLVGDVMYDVLMEMVETAAQTSTVVEQLGLDGDDFLLATVHRAENTDEGGNLLSILRAFGAIVENKGRIVFPVHPRTRKRIDDLAFHPPPGLMLVEPLSYLDMVALECRSRYILTDSGGVQKEAYWLGIPCVTLREETEWVETLHQGYNRLAGRDHVRITEGIRSAPSRRPVTSVPWPWQRGDASRLSAGVIVDYLAHA